MNPVANEANQNSGRPWHRLPSLFSYNHGRLSSCLLLAMNGHDGHDGQVDSALDRPHLSLRLTPPLVQDESRSTRHQQVLS